MNTLEEKTVFEKSHLNLANLYGQQINYDLSYRDVIEILNIIDNWNYNVINLELGGLKLTIDKTEKQVLSTSETMKEQISENGNASSSQGNNGKLFEVSDNKVDEEKNLGAKKLESVDEVKVKSSIPGIFYKAPSPNEAPFVEVGSIVKKGQQVGVVEVMKVFNSINAPSDGTIKEIFVENEQMIEAKQVLMTIEPLK